jgi:ferredoxin
VKLVALLINEECINCGACEPECPNEAISEGEEIYVIDPERCNECVGFHDEPQCISVCPVECIFPNPDHEESKEELLEKKARLHPE